MWVAVVVDAPGVAVWPAAKQGAGDAEMGAEQQDGQPRGLRSA